MKINEIFNKLCEYAPIKLSEDFCKAENAYDNSGIIVDLTEDITGVVFSLDLTLKTVEYAISVGANLIITHHPAIYYPIKNIKGNTALYSAIQNKIGVVSMHLNFDSCEKGIDYYFAKGLGAKNQEILLKFENNQGYGRKFTLNGITLKEVAKNYEKEFKTQRYTVYGNFDKKINAVCSYCGGGLEIENVLKEDADLFVSADVPHHVIKEVLEKGKCLLSVSHYSSEIYGFSKIYENLKEKINEKTYLFVEETYM